MDESANLHGSIWNVKKLADGHVCESHFPSFLYSKNLEKHGERVKDAI